MTEQQQRESVTFNRKEFIDFLEWVDVKGSILTTDDGKETFMLEGNMGNTFDLETPVRPHTPARGFGGLVGITKKHDRLRLLYPNDFALQLNEQQLKQEQIEHDATVARTATLAALNRGALVDLGIMQGMLYEFCEWFCDSDCEEKPCTMTVSYLHERLEGIKKKMGIQKS
jgi:hypothetical protein